MSNIVRTTIRVRKDLLDQSRFLALRHGSTLQEEINNLLAQGLKNISDFNRHKEAMAGIDEFRESMKGKKINVEKLLEQNKRELQERTDRLLDPFLHHR